MDTRLSKDDASMLLSTVRSEGWMILEKLISSDIESLQLKLIASDDDTETRNLKYRIRALTALQRWPRQIIDDAFAAAKAQADENDLEQEATEP